MRPRSSPPTSACTIWVPRPSAPGAKPAGSPTPSSETVASRCRPSRLRGDRHGATGGADPVLDRVGHQFGEHQGQRRGVLAGHLAEGPFAAHVHRSSTARRPRRRAPACGRARRRSRPSRRAPPRASRAPARSWRPGARPPAGPSRPSPDGMRRACRRSSAATVCRLFLTRWWISRIVASLVSSSRSRRRSSVTSRSSTSAPMRCPARRSGMARSDSVVPPGLEVAAPGRPAGQHERQRLVDRCAAVEQRSRRSRPATGRRRRRRIPAGAGPDSALGLA